MISLRIKRAIRSAALSTAFLAAPILSGQAQRFASTEAEDEAGGGDTSSGAISSKPATCANRLSEEPRARVFLPPQQPKSDRRHGPKTQRRIDEGRLTLSRMIQRRRSSRRPLYARSRQRSAIAASPVAAGGPRSPSPLAQMPRPERSIGCASAFR
jgi:hypothetical protein